MFNAYLGHFIISDMVSFIRFTTRSWVQGFPDLSANIGNFVGQEKRRPRKPLKTEANYL